MSTYTKNLDHMERLVESTISQHKEQFGTTLTKKELRSAVSGAIEKKRQEWIKGRVTDHSVGELFTLMDAIDNHNTTIKDKTVEQKATVLEKISGKRRKRSKAG